LSGTIRPPTPTVNGARDDDQTLSVGVHLKHNTRSSNLVDVARFGNAVVVLVYTPT